MENCQGRCVLFSKQQPVKQRLTCQTPTNCDIINISKNSRMHVHAESKHTGLIRILLQATHNITNRASILIRSFLRV